MSHDEINDQDLTECSTVRSSTGGRGAVWAVTNTGSLSGRSEVFWSLPAVSPTGQERRTITFNLTNEGRQVKNILGVWAQVLQEKTGAVSQELLRGSIFNILIDVIIVQLDLIFDHLM